jgi:hypothetical protein
MCAVQEKADPAAGNRPVCGVTWHAACRFGMRESHYAGFPACNQAAHNVIG